jgi:hypothetical protein
MRQSNDEEFTPKYYGKVIGEQVIGEKCVEVLVC